MVRALASHARGQGFKSLCLHHAKAPLNGVLLRGEIGFAKRLYYQGFTRVSENKQVIGQKNAVSVYF